MLYYKKITNEKANDSLVLAYRMIAPESVVLDVGCACGGLAEKLAKEKLCRVYGLEYNAKSVAVCKKLKVFEEIWQQDLNKVSSKDYPEYVNKFDYIVCADVLEHLQRPDIVLRILKQWLKPEGAFVISLPNVAHASMKTNLLLNDFTYTDIGILDKTHIHFYTYKSIARLLADSGIKIMRVSAVTMPLDGWQPHRLSELPPETAAFIKKDIHSHIMQYVMLCSPDKRGAVRHNIKMFDSLKVSSASKRLFQIKRFVVVKMPVILKLMERLWLWKKS